MRTFTSAILFLFLFLQFTTLSFSQQIDNVAFATFRKVVDGELLQVQSNMVSTTILNPTATPTNTGVPNTPTPTSTNSPTPSATPTIIINTPTPVNTATFTNTPSATPTSKSPNRKTPTPRPTKTPKTRFLWSESSAETKFLSFDTVSSTSELIATSSDPSLLASDVSTLSLVSLTTDSSTGVRQLKLDSRVLASLNIKKEVKILACGDLVWIVNEKKAKSVSLRANNVKARRIYKLSRGLDSETATCGPNSSLLMFNSAQKRISTKLTQIFSSGKTKNLHLGFGEIQSIMVTSGGSAFITKETLVLFNFQKRKVIDAVNLGIGFEVLDVDARGGTLLKKGNELYHWDPVERKLIFIKSISSDLLGSANGPLKIN